jgi:signal transduction histidine kinase
MKTRFVSNISHELRTPITTIKLYAHLMKRQPERWQEHLSILAQEADHQAQLVEDILQISHIDAGRLEMAPRPTALDSLTDIVVASHQAMANRQGLTLKHSSGEPDPVALVDPKRMTQVLNNLIENAIRYTPSGGTVTVHTSTQEAEGRAWATTTVMDTGMGVEEEDVPYIFDRFFRGVAARSMQIPGSGLGLAIVKEIVELHGGHVTLETRKGIGSTFTVWLPPSDQELT